MGTKISHSDSVSGKAYSDYSHGGQHHLQAMESRLVHWGKVIAGVVSKLVDHVEKSKLSPINPYLFHLYH